MTIRASTRRAAQSPSVIHWAPAERASSPRPSINCSARKAATRSAPCVSGSARESRWSSSVSDIRTQVGIVGAGPAGLLLAHLLHLEGIESVVIENRSQQYVIERVRAGVLEQGTVDLLHEMGLGSRLARQGMRHEGIYLAFNGVRHRIDFAALTGRAIAIYGQNEVVTDLIHARQSTGRPLFFEASGVAIHDFENTAPRITFTDGG